MKTLQFVEGQPYENKSKLSIVMPDLLLLIKHSDFITVVLLTDGSDEIHGTPFDGKINEFFQSWRDRQKRLKMPITVFLRGQKGRITDYRVSTPPWPFRIASAGLMRCRSTRSCRSISFIGARSKYVPLLTRLAAVMPLA